MEQSLAALDAALKTMTRALRPWTLDFHVAQNDATVKGSGSHDKTGRHCLPDDPNGKLDVARHAGFWMRDDSGKPTRAFAHICWDGCMFPNATMMQPGHLDRRARHDDRGAQRARLELTMGKTPLNIALVGYGFMGQDPQQRVSAGAAVLRPAVSAGAEGRGRAQRRPRARVRGQLGLRVRRDRLAHRGRAQGHRSRSTSPARTIRHAEIAIAAARAGKMVTCEKPLGRTAAEAQAMVVGGRSGWRRQHGLVQLPPRAGAWCCSSSLIDEGKLGRIFHYRAQFLQDWTISRGSAPGRRGAVAARRRRRRQRRDRRPARALHRHGALAERVDRGSDRDDRDLHQGAHAHADRTR